MEKKQLINEIRNSKLVFPDRIRFIINEYQALAIPAGYQELCLLARLQTGLEQRLKKEYKLINVQLRLKIKTILQAVLERKMILLTPVEKKIHFIWIGNMGVKQIAYMKAWVYYNPDYEINLWHDPGALLADVLRQRIKRQAGMLLGIGNDIGPDSIASLSIRAPPAAGVMPVDYYVVRTSRPVIKIASDRSWNSSLWPAKWGVTPCRHLARNLTTTPI
ncbi:TcdA/TcdB catalytic glycosyltransferase domain-containing protein [Candidatus Fukatsuia symbiotica]|nr:TcdA/TcdB catalytic glycosyltransferase domain-containing protein [Candidatus Fukatsuia symbiotica]MEA9446064.1 TcdA/TcdB catalytic glycosyltransferase domain-containing protein [Candidatus Fukatsuia symbiotica]